ncbi:MAG: hypothetical protein S4CHLAM81_00950 [Chlamydiales bacterium]|nr:hypothetical protein [Chlamydiales bacterium]MCH9634891.1 hypothetical protein [Chlamydiales bacterium]MCH9704039.1 hypothetical protein [Chlamydiota bacterium]
MTQPISFIPQQDSAIDLTYSGQPQGQVGQVVRPIFRQLPPRACAMPSQGGQWRAVNPPAGPPIYPGPHGQVHGPGAHPPRYAGSTFAPPSSYSGPIAQQGYSTQAMPHGRGAPQMGIPRAAQHRPPAGLQPPMAVPYGSQPRFQGPMAVPYGSQPRFQGPMAVPRFQTPAGQIGPSRMSTPAGQSGPSRVMTSHHPVSCSMPYDQIAPERLPIPRRPGLARQPQRNLGQQTRRVQTAVGQSVLGPPPGLGYPAGQPSRLPSASAMPRQQGRRIALLVKPMSEPRRQDHPIEANYKLTCCIGVHPISLIPSLSYTPCALPNSDCFHELDVPRDSESVTVAFLKRRKYCIPQEKAQVIYSILHRCNVQTLLFLHDTATRYRNRQEGGSALKPSVIGLTTNSGEIIDAETAALILQCVKVDKASQKLAIEGSVRRP